MASIFGRVAWVSCALRAHAARFLWLAGTAVVLVASAPSETRAQFVCAGTIGATDVTCTNTGTTAVPFLQDQLGAFNLTTNSSGASNGITTTSVDGNVIATNSGINADMLETTASGLGNATSNNLGTIGSYISTLTGAGNATSINSGTVVQDITTIAQDGGNALTNNSGSTLAITTSTVPGSALVGGSATTNNSGSVSSFVATIADGGGNATTNNSGTIAGILNTQTSNGGAGFGAGTATSINSGAADFIVTQTFDGGNAVTINSGKVLGFNGIQTITVDGGNATTINAGFVNGSIATASGLSIGDGNATTINAGVVNGLIQTGVGGNGNAVAVNSGSVLEGMLSAVAGDGNAATTNFGYVTGLVISQVAGNGHASVVNYGTIDSQGISPVGSQVMFGAASVTNVGRILGTVGASVFFDGTATITNAGLIDGSVNGTPTGSAIFFDADPSNPAAHTTLNILPGSRIIGTIELAGDTFYSGSGTSVNIFSGHDISSVLTFGGGCGCGGGLVDTGATVNVIGGAPYVINGNTVAILDPTSFAMQDRNVIDVTRSISSLVTSRLTNPAPISGNGSSAIGFAPSGNVARDMANDAFSGIPALAYADNDRVLLSNPSFTAADGTRVWAQGFGGQRIQRADAPTLRSVNNFYGGVLGVDKTVQPGLRLGGFIGAGNIKSTIELNAGDTSSDLVFGGIYGRYVLGRAFLDFSLLGGHSNNDVRRTIANNLVPGGYEYAAGKYDGWFVSPEIAYGLSQALSYNLTLTPTARVRYLAAGFGGYQESGSSTNLSVGSRTSHNFEERGELKLTHTTNATPTEQLQLSGSAGLIALQRVGDSTVNTILLGQSLAFATPGKSSVIGFYAGAGFDWRNASGISVFGAAEYTAMSDSSQTITGRGGVKVSF